MPRALKVCSASGCTELVAAGRCAEHQSAAENRRGTSTRRGYGARHDRRFKAGVHRKHPLCVCTSHDH
ncbi:MAG TPA: hypothetical protein VKN76_16885, partial [Kiloniellaceae bacterium]|nr:hypothetical protein [Kiloniellaceae bacterium]